MTAPQLQGKVPRIPKFFPLAGPTMGLSVPLPLTQALFSSQIQALLPPPHIPAVPPPQVWLWLWTLSPLQEV